MEKTQYIKIHQNDNVAVALQPLSAGSVFEGVTLTEDIMQGHKFALDTISAGKQVIKYGYPIGRATCDISKGELSVIQPDADIYSTTFSFVFRSMLKIAVIAPKIKIKKIIVEIMGFWFLKFFFIKFASRFNICLKAAEYKTE